MAAKKHHKKTVHVKGHRTSDGTWIPPHNRSKPHHHKKGK
jgi:hypothetical protein